MRTIEVYIAIGSGIKVVEDVLFYIKRFVIEFVVFCIRAVIGIKIYDSVYSRLIV